MIMKEKYFTFCNLINVVKLKLYKKYHFWDNLKKKPIFLLKEQNSCCLRTLVHSNGS